MIYRCSASPVTVTVSVGSERERGRNLLGGIDSTRSNRHTIYYSDAHYFTIVSKQLIIISINILDNALMYTLIKH